VPFDATRVKLEKPLSICRDSETGSDYINASFISDFSCQQNGHAYIAAQGPSEETIGLFWEMIWQQNVRFCYVILF